MKNVLFIGEYPNSVDKYLSVFFRNLIYAIADENVNCYVISPVSVTKYRKKIKNIERFVVETNKNGNKIFVSYPRFISTSSKKIAGFQTGLVTVKNYISAAMKEAKKLNVDFDAVYGHFFVSGGLSAIRVGRYLNIPSFVAYGECDYKSQIPERFRNLRESDLTGLTGVVSVSQKNTKELDETGLFENIPVFTCENAIDMTLFNNCTKEEARKKFNLPEDKFIVGFVGGFINRKGDKRLLEACRNLGDVYLAFAGKGDNPPEGDNIVFCNGVNHDEIGDFLSAIDVFCLPTLNEGCCNAVLEAMAAGKAIISSDLPFNDGVLTNENSIRINPESIEEIRGAIIKLKEDEEFRNTIANNAMKDSKNFTIEKRAEKIYNFMFESKEAK